MRVMDDGRRPPRISIVTPSYNQGQFIEETIRSVLLQGYPDVEYMIVDGGSEDDTVQVIKKYQHWLAFWVSERDSGQAHAINKGIGRASGQIFNWINSDDYLAESALVRVASRFEPGGIIAGCVRDRYPDGSSRTFKNRDLSLEAALEIQGLFAFHQPGIFLDTDWIRRFGLNQDLHYVFDYHFMLRCLASQAPVTYCDDVYANFRHHDQSKTVSLQEQFWPERRRVLDMLIEDRGMSQWRTQLESFARRVDWYVEVRKLISGEYRGTMLGALHRCITNPAARLDRYTLRAVRRVLMPGLERWLAQR